MLLTEVNIDIWYSDYLNQFKKSEKFVKSRKGRTRGWKPLSREEFKYDFISEVNDNPKLSGKQVAVKMAKHDVYGTTYKQATKLAEAFSRETGMPMSLSLVTKFMAQSTTLSGFFDQIRQRRQEFEQEGISTYTANKLIGQEFFGSE